MADKRISELPIATSVLDTDVVIVNRLVDGVLTTEQVEIKLLSVASGNDFIDITASGNLKVNGTTDFVGNTTVDNLTTSGNLKVNGTTDFVGNTTVDNLTASGTLNGSNLSGTNTGDNPGVTNVTIVTANNLQGSVSNSTTTPSITLSTVGSPVSTLDVANKGYVDSVAQGLSTKPSAVAASTVALPANVYSNGSSGVGATLTGSATGVLTVDGVAILLNDYVLVKDEAAGANNGLYKCSTEGAVGVVYVLTRAVEMDDSPEYVGAYVFIEQGTTYISTGWVCTNTSAPIVGTTPITFSQFSGAVEIANTIHAATNKPTLSAADELGLWDSVTGLLNKITATELFSLPHTLQVFLTGSGTYTLPANCKAIEVTIVGGGGGGGGGGTLSTATGGGIGGTTTFGPLSATGGAAGGAGAMPGGTGSIGAGATGVTIVGNAGTGWVALDTQFCSGGTGGGGLWGGGGGGVPNSYGLAAAANSGGGGGGGGTTNAPGLHYGASGGGAGGAVIALIAAPTSTYSYSVGSGGGGGSGGTDGFAGASGGSGIILVKEYYS